MNRSIPSDVWQTPEFRELKPNAKLVWLYLRTSPHSHLSGLYALPVSYIAHETGLELDEIKDVMADLKGAKLADYDSRNELVWVSGMAGSNGWSAKIKVAIASQATLFANSSLVKEYLGTIDTLSIPYRYPIDTPLSDQVRSDQDQIRSDQVRSDQSITLSEGVCAPAREGTESTPESTLKHDSPELRHSLFLHAIQNLNLCGNEVAEKARTQWIKRCREEGREKSVLFGTLDEAQTSFDAYLAEGASAQPPKLQAVPKGDAA